MCIKDAPCRKRVGGKEERDCHSAVMEQVFKSDFEAHLDELEEKIRQRCPDADTTDIDLIRQQLSMTRSDPLVSEVD